MKSYIIEPIYKKSIVEYTRFIKDDLILIREDGWRWGSYVITLPSTEEEFQEWYTNAGFDSLEEVMETYSSVFEDETIADKYLAICGPNPDDESHDLDDYECDLIETNDGCWGSWSIDTRNGLELDEDEKDALIEEIEELYSEGYIEALEAEGWANVYSWTEIQCPITIKECTD